MMKLKTSRGTKIHILRAGMTNCYLIQKDKINLLVDSGISKSYQSLMRQLKVITGAPSSLDYHLLTHTHYDHAGNSNRIKEEFQARVIVHEHEAAWIEKGFTRLPGGTSWCFKLISNAGNRYASSIGKYEPTLPDILIRGELTLDEYLKIIPTPGHTLGSVSLLVDDEIALVGDTLFGVFKNKIFPPFADDVETLYRSWKILFDTGCNLFLPGHGKPIPRKLLNQGIQKIRS
ncbi:MAG: MBL fold metallo-hydrolase [Bacteroidales bacterium]|jgi:glyoxylase-like metal-dependent hydrolase (beta-lactamase superfamily II)|nr:MBL fold metallo-hydrolase [Bacteroidales bacterium]